MIKVPDESYEGVARDSLSGLMVAHWCAWTSYAMYVRLAITGHQLVHRRPFHWYRIMVVESILHSQFHSVLAFAVHSFSGVMRQSLFVLRYSSCIARFQCFHASGSGIGCLGHCRVEPDRLGPLSIT